MKKTYSAKPASSKQDTGNICNNLLNIMKDLAKER